MMLLGLLRSSPAVQAVMATVLAFALVAAGVGMLRRDARVQAVAQCAAEKEVADLKREVAQQALQIIAFQADKAAADRITQHQLQQLAASEAQIKARENDLEELRKQMAGNPDEGETIFHVGDSWLESRRVRASGSSSPGAGRGR